jgi:CRISPR-associated exonuclease Cas4
VEPSPELVSASDIEKYGYCPMSWWLSRSEPDEEEEEPLREGQALHDALARELDGIRDRERLAKESETMILWFAVAASIIAVIGINLIADVDERVSEIMISLSLIWLLAAVYFLYRAETRSAPDSHLRYQRIILVFAIVAVVIALTALSQLALSVFWSRVFEASALLWLIGASYFLYWSLRHMEMSRRKREEHRVVGGVAYVDSAGKKPELLVSSKYGVSGRPDLILELNGARIPVEIKTGRVPRGPLFSHILQVAAYCLILEDLHGQPVTHGILRYGSTDHEVEFNAELRKLLLDKVGEIRKASVSGGAHRNHNRPSKCKGCSRRGVCQERLA